jgi:phytoene dehydrogenase-like protein
VRAGQPPGPNWAEFGELTGRIASAVFPTLTEPLISRAELRSRVGDDAAWEALIERPLGKTLAHYFTDDLERGIVATDALIGTFAGIDDESLRQNRCFLYHVIGNGTGDWDVPVGGMGKLTESLAGIAWAAGAELRTDVEVTKVETDGVGAEVHYEGGIVSARHVLANVAPGRARAAARRGAAGSGARGRAAEAEHAAQAPAEAAREVHRSARGVRRDLPRQRVGRRSSPSPTPRRTPAACPSSRRARSTATR